MGIGQLWTGPVPGCTIKKIHPSYDCRLCRNARMREYRRKGKFGQPDTPRRRVSQILRKLVRIGTIKRGECELCKRPAAHGHHPDYRFPTKVTWLCDAHHKIWHKYNQPVDAPEPRSIYQKTP